MHSDFLGGCLWFAADSFPYMKTVLWNNMCTFVHAFVHRITHL